MQRERDETYHAPHEFETKKKRKKEKKESSRNKTATIVSGKRDNEAKRADTRKKPGEFGIWETARGADGICQWYLQLTVVQSRPEIG